LWISDLVLVHLF